MAGRARSLLEKFLVAAAVSVAAGGIPQLHAQTEVNEATVTGFSIPEVDDEGRMRWKVMGESARFKPQGPVHIEGARLEMYRDEQVDIVLTTPHCTYDRQRQEAKTDSPVRIEGKDVVVTGNGFFWSGTSNLVVIRKNARVVMYNDGSVAGKPDKDADAKNRLKEKEN